MNIKSFFQMLNHRWSLAAKSRKHPNKPSRGVFTPKNDYGAGILEAAHAMQADLIVMGAWGHSRIAELVLGGATRHLFQHSDLPLFVAH